MKIKTRWFMIEIKHYPRCDFKYSQEKIDEINADCIKQELKTSNDRRCNYYQNYDHNNTGNKGCPFHRDVKEVK